MSKVSAKEKSPLKVVGFVLQILIIIITVIISIVTLVNMNGKSQDEIKFNSKGKAYMPVLTESMDGDKEDSFKKGAMIIVQKVSLNEAQTLKKGDIITFKAKLAGTNVNGFITHRIEEVVYNQEGGVIKYITKGDNNNGEDDYYIAPQAVLAKYTGKSIAGLGSFVEFFKKPIVFLIAIILPLAILFAINGFNLIKMMVDNKHKKMLSAVADSEEEIKKRAIEEFLASQQNKNNENK